MSILDSSIAPALFALAGFGVLAGFFRKTLVFVLATIVVEIIFFALFPTALLSFVHLVTSIRQSFG